VRKLGHSLISQKYFEIEIEREKRSEGEKRSLRKRAPGKRRCNTPIFNISLLILLLNDINIINSIDWFDIINLIIRIY